jgi:nucleoside 2-deoxyribosyltransferase
MTRSDQTAEWAIDMKTPTPRPAPDADHDRQPARSRTSIPGPLVPCTAQASPPIPYPTPAATNAPDSPPGDDPTPVPATSCGTSARHRRARRTKRPGSNALTATDTEHLTREITDQILRRLRHRGLDTGTVSTAADRPLVFVACPFDPEMEPVFEAIAAAAKATGLRAERIKDINGDYRITDKILAMIQSACLIVADLSHERPNVYFELGYARGVGKTVITILRVGSATHFNIQDWTYLEYIDSRPLERQLRERFKYEFNYPAEHNKDNREIRADYRDS